MDAVAESTTMQTNRTAFDLSDRILVVDRRTGELLDVLGDRLESNSSIAKAVAVATAALSSLEGALGGTLQRLEVELSSGCAVVQVDKAVVKVHVRSW